MPFNMQRVTLCVVMAAVVHGHMGISTPRPMDRNVGDPYRYPVVAGQSSANGGVCHGQTSGGDKVSGNVDLKMSGGAAHNGGPCGAYVCDRIPSKPFCQRLNLPDMDGCTLIDEQEHCTLKGNMAVNNVAGGKYLIWIWTPVSSGTCEIYMNCWEIEDGAVQETLPPTQPPTPVLQTPPPTPPPTDATTGSECGSLKSYISNSWCQSHNCDPVYYEFCGQVGGTQPPAAPEQTQSPTMQPTTPAPTQYQGQECQLYQIQIGDTWATVATMYDLPALAQILNPALTEAQLAVAGESMLKQQNAGRAFQELKVIEIPGDCPEPEGGLKPDDGTDGGSGSPGLSDGQEESGAGSLNAGVASVAMAVTAAVLIA